MPPIYTAENVKVIHRLHYCWSGWLKERSGSFPRTLGAAFEQCRDAWKDDGLELEHWNTDADQLQCLVAAQPGISPVTCCARIKGRLQHALRKLGTPTAFSRKVGFRSLGENTREIVAAYVARQADKSDYVDDRFKDWLDRFRIAEPECLTEPTISAHGRYWYNLHLVVVVADRRYPMTRRETFHTLRSEMLRIAQESDCGIGSLAPMPDHVHAALRGDIRQSPLELALTFLNGLANALGRNRCWSQEVYTGTFSEYEVARVVGQ